MTGGRSDGLMASQIVAGYGEMEILHGVSLEVRNGEIVAMIGPNGSGKSTLMKVLSGLVAPWSGSIRLHGRDITAASPRERLANGVAYVPQLRNVFTNMTVLENLQMGTFLRPKREKEEIERAFAAFPALAERRRALAGRLSGGQRQMVAIARALMSCPSVLLLDEPSGGLAPKIVEEVFERVRAITDTGLAVVLVEQNARKALGIANRAYVLAEGLNKLHGAGAALLGDPEVNAIYLGAEEV